MKAPAVVRTSRLLLRKPRMDDAEAIFTRYASDRDALKFMSWPAHESLEDTRDFLEMSEREWHRWPGGPYLILSSEDGLLLGGTGFAFEAPDSAATGYVLARDAWGRGFATEALLGVLAISKELGVRRLSAVCHRQHRASARVLEKAGFELEAREQKRLVFPNLSTEPQDVLAYSVNPLWSVEQKR